MYNIEQPCTTFLIVSTSPLGLLATSNGDHFSWACGVVMFSTGAELGQDAECLYLLFSLVMQCPIQASITVKPCLVHGITINTTLQDKGKMSPAWSGWHHSSITNTPILRGKVEFSWIAPAGGPFLRTFPLGHGTLILCTDNSTTNFMVLRWGPNTNYWKRWGLSRSQRITRHHREHMVTSGEGWLCKG